MSKNVAVFVDVANIFYAAKAAGVDIDYVTLLKSATAGRDFVRAYAYTGLDPENENQRQFHSFLSRSGYKVVSKDIRKYGDGRIKANLDIELVVDLMRMADHVDIAVVVSGDGDFAPAIRAVQQMGVRVEVISFRGNTSSDLIEVADVFTDIAQIARVEKGARSGRRVASADDLSMTEVPDKETDLGSRRRRGRRGEGEERRPRVAAAPVALLEPVGLPAGLVALPGERLSRAGTEEPAPAVEAQHILVQAADDAAEGEAEAGRRRRRRRGGRGRGRGGRAEEAVVVGAEQPADESPEDELLEEEVPTLPQHSTFGSVWDRQIGVPTTARSTTEHEEHEPLEDEPEVPEYLLAERRQQGGRRGARGRGGRATATGGYQSAVDRERYGRGGYGGSTSHSAGRGGGQRSQGSPQRGPRPVQPPPAVRPVQASTEPWSEVPPEVQELLRAELARRQAKEVRPVSPPEPAPDDRAEGIPSAAPAPSRTRGPRRPAPAEGTLVGEPAAAAPAQRRTSTRRAAGTAALGGADLTDAATEPLVTTPEEQAAAPQETVPKVVRRRATASTSSPAAAKATGRRKASAPADKASAPAAKAEEEGAAPGEASAPASGADAEARQPRRRTTRSKATADSAES